MKTVKVPLYPTAKQKLSIFQQLGAAKYVCNRSLALRKFSYTKFGIKLGRFDLIKRVTSLEDREST